MHIYQIYTYKTRVETNLNVDSIQLLESDPEAQFVLNLVASARQVHPFALLSKKRGDERVCLSRQIAMYLTNVILRRSLTYTGVLFDRDRRTVAYACGRIEDLRERPHFDRVLSCFERTLILASEDIKNIEECG